jgi:hypothetical protein
MWHNYVLAFFTLWHVHGWHFSLFEKICFPTRGKNVEILKKILFAFLVAFLPVVVGLPIVAVGHLGGWYDAPRYAHVYNEFRFWVFWMVLMVYVIIMWRMLGRFLPQVSEELEYDVGLRHVCQLVLLLVLLVANGFTWAWLDEENPGVFSKKTVWVDSGTFYVSGPHGAVGCQVTANPAPRYMWESGVVVYQYGGEWQVGVPIKESDARIMKVTFTYPRDAEALQPMLPLLKECVPVPDAVEARLAEWLNAEGEVVMAGIWPNQVQVNMQPIGAAYAAFERWWSTEFPFLILGNVAIEQQR